MLLIAVFVAVVLCVNAHKGNTDGNGGHTDHSTGEYHYHHGQPAHDHSDVDGDGDIDCPYNFKGVPSMYGSQSYDQHDIYHPEPTKVSTLTEAAVTEKTTADEKVYDDSPWLPILIYGGLVTVFIAYYTLPKIRNHFKKRNVCRK